MSTLPPPTENDRGPARPSRRWLLALAVTFVCAALLLAAGVAACLWWLEKKANEQPDRPKHSVAVVIPHGSSLQSIARALEDKDLIDNRRLFLAYVWRHHIGSRLQAGDYRLNTRMSVAELARALQQGHFEKKVTFPEGLTTEQIAFRMQDAGFVRDENEFLDLKTDPQLIAQAKARSHTVEGFLFPETYFFEPGMTVRQMAERMIQTFNQQANDVLSSPTLQLGKPLSRLELVTLASMIEREARTPEEMPLMASVYYNRLKKDMRMECDATVRYAMNVWTRPLTYKDLEFDSPFNTYRHKGLPPAPICNPSLDALRAAARPAQSDYLFYVYRGDNSHEYTKTFKEHEAAIKKYLHPSSAHEMEKHPSVDVWSESNGNAGSRPSLAGRVY